CMQGLEYPLTF
nr:immunoglobulin light chain junction region [Macaca mulatta]MOV62742.1 immunoglobulin light chain junction region [Macaca mulatta]MOV63120.1 immunoglobulin light chain junction region [Macaca mulatta]MOV76957.1 immunoglobulin light chain junction region [Macaca mulatta]MOX08635.1 immunoglobulin light chain junction region [Macaca mulatta]